MNEAMITFLDIVSHIAQYSIAWALGIKAYRYVVDAMTGRNARI